MIKYKKGDRVRVVIVGEVDETAMDDSLRLRGWRYYLSEDSPGVVTIEKLPDLLPTTPGSVVRSRQIHDELLMLLDDGRGWVDVDNQVTPWSLSPDHYETVFDAGKVS